MRISTFHKEFTKDLESFLHNPIQISPLGEWDPEKPAAPERHILNGSHHPISIDILIYTLERENIAFEQISSLLRIYLDRKVMRNLKKIDPVKEQIWLFAYKWFSAYYDILTDPDILKSEFYRTHHDDFLNVLRKMLDLQPRRRISFYLALKEWNPSSLPEEKDSDEEEYNEQEPTDISKVNTIHTTTLDEAQEPIDSDQKIEFLPTLLLDIDTVTKPSLSSEASVANVSSSKHRLVLNGHPFVLGHNKTRKNLRS